MISVMAATRHEYTNNSHFSAYSQEEIDESDTIDFEGQEQARQDASTNSTPDYSAWDEALRVRPEDEIEAPPTCLSIQQGDSSFIFGTLGNFSVLIGKAKSRKTFTISIAVAAALKWGSPLNGFVGSFKEDKQTVLYFDTEQGRYHVHRVVKRICRLAEKPAPENLLVYSLRALSTKDRLAFIRWKIYQTPNVGLVVIDGIRDTVEDINDNAEATERVGDLLRWTEQRNIHVLTVIHMNKGNDQIRGSIGTELQNKAETVVSVALDPNDKAVSVVTAEYCRDKEFEPFAFSINEQGLPYLLDDWQADDKPARKAAKEGKKSKEPRSITPGYLTADVHRSILQKAFSDVEPGKYAATCNRIKIAAEYLGHKFGDNRAKEFVTYYLDKSYLVKADQLYALGNLPESTSESGQNEVV